MPPEEAPSQTPAEEASRVIRGAGEPPEAGQSPSQVVQPEVSAQPPAEEVSPRLLGIETQVNELTTRITALEQQVAELRVLLTRDLQKAVGEVVRPAVEQSVTPLQQQIASLEAQLRQRGIQAPARGEARPAPPAGETTPAGAEAQPRVEGARLADEQRVIDRLNVIQQAGEQGQRRSIGKPEYLKRYLVGKGLSEQLFQALEQSQLREVAEKLTQGRTIDEVLHDIPAPEAPAPETPSAAVSEQVGRVGLSRRLARVGEKLLGRKEPQERPAPGVVTGAAPETTPPVGPAASGETQPATPTPAEVRTATNEVLEKLLKGLDKKAAIGLVIGAGILGFQGAELILDNQEAAKVFVDWLGTGGTSLLASGGEIIANIPWEQWGTALPNIPEVIGQGWDNIQQASLELLNKYPGDLKRVADIVTGLGMFFGGTGALRLTGRGIGGAGRWIGGRFHKPTPQEVAQPPHSATAISAPSGGESRS